MTVNNTLSAFFVTMYQNDKSCLSFLFESYVPNYIMLKTYTLFVRYKEIIKTEELEEEYKKELVEKCRATGIKFNNKSLIDAAKILYTIKFINENFEKSI